MLGLLFIDQFEAGTKWINSLCISPTAVFVSEKNHILYIEFRIKIIHHYIHLWLG